jgi:hypothetical protein
MCRRVTAPKYSERCYVTCKYVVPEQIEAIRTTVRALARALDMQIDEDSDEAAINAAIAALYTMGSILVIASRMETSELQDIFDESYALAGVFHDGVVADRQKRAQTDETSVSQDVKSLKYLN